MSEHHRPGLRSLDPGTRPDLRWVEIAHANPFIASIYVGDDDLSDVVAHVNNIEIVRWLDRVAEMHADSVGYTRARMLSDGVMWFVARHEIDYLAESWPGDELVIATWVRDMSRVKSWRDTIVMRPADHMVICRASTLWVLVDLASRRPARIPADMIARFDPLHVAVKNQGDTTPCTSP